MQKTSSDDDVFISYAGEEEEVFAVQLRLELQRLGICVFARDRGVLIEKRSGPPVEGGCTGAKLVVFVINRRFLCSSHCLDELHWVLDKRKRRNDIFPEILVVRYPPGDNTVFGRNARPLNHQLRAVFREHLETELVNSSLLELCLSLVSLAGSWACLALPDMRIKCVGLAAVLGASLAMASLPERSFHSQWEDLYTVIRKVWHCKQDLECLQEYVIAEQSAR